MADISILARLVNGATRNVDLTTNTPVVLSIKIGGVTNTELTKAILDNLISLQNGSDVSASLHHHDGRYFTESELSSTSGTSGAERIGVEATPSNYTAAQQNVEAHLAGIDAALANAGTDELVKISANDTTAGYLEDKVVVDNGTNATNPLEASTLNDGGNEDLRIRFDQSKVDHGSIAGLGDDDHTQYTRADGTRAFTGDQSMGSNKLTNLAAGTAASDATRKDQQILRDGSQAFTADQSMGGFKLTGLAAPSAASDAATKGYVDSALEGLRPKEAVRVATTGPITLSGTQTIDGVSVVAGNRVLVKDQAAPENNGIYVVAAGAWSRASDFDSLSPIDEINKAYVAVQEGTANAGKLYVQYGQVTTLGTDAINFTFFNSVSGLVGGDGITVSGSNISVDHDGQGLDFVAGQLALELDGGTLSKSAAGVKVADSGITSTQLANDAVVEAKIANNAVTTNKIADDAVTNAKIADNAVDSLQIAANAVIEAKIADNAVTANKIAANAVTETKIANDAVTTNKIANDAVTTGKLAATSVTAAKLGNDVAGAGLAGGNGSALTVSYAPLAQRTMVAGEAFAADTSFLVRMARNGETAGRVYKADYDASSNDNFYAIGIARSVAGVSAGQNINVIMLGSHSLGAGDTAFNAADIGRPVFLTASGAFSVTAPSSVNQAVYRIGIVETTTSVMVQPQLIGVL